MLKISLNQKKTLIVGVTIGLLVASMFTPLVPSFANEVRTYVLQKVTYPIVVNNQEYTNDELPVLNYQGSTYVPLKAIGDILEGNVEWNPEMGRVEIGSVGEEVSNTVASDVKDSKVINNTKLNHLSRDSVVTNDYLILDNVKYIDVLNIPEFSAKFNIKKNSNNISISVYDEDKLINDNIDIWYFNNHAYIKYLDYLKYIKQQ